jgi:hypothetical protein
MIKGCIQIQKTINLAIYKITTMNEWVHLVMWSSSPIMSPCINKLIQGPYIQILYWSCTSSGKIYYNQWYAQKKSTLFFLAVLSETALSSVFISRKLHRWWIYQRQRMVLTKQNALPRASHKLVWFKLDLFPSNGMRLPLVGKPL